MHWAASARYSVDLGPVLPCANSLKTARGSIVTFLLMQATHLCTENEGKIGVSHPLSECVLSCSVAESISVLIW